MKQFIDRKTVEWEEDGRLYTVYVEDIQYIEVEDKYTYVFVGAEKYLVRRSLREWETMLPKSDFGMANRSCLVNLGLLDRVKSEIVLDDGKINAVGSHEELLGTNEIYTEVYKSQQEGSVA